MIKIKLLMRGINEFDITQEKVGSNYYGTVNWMFVRYDKNLS